MSKTRQFGLESCFHDEIQEKMQLQLVASDVALGRSSASWEDNLGTGSDDMILQFLSSRG